MNMGDFKPKHFNWVAQNGVATITLKGAERKNPITFESYAELGQTFRDLSRASDIKTIVFGSNGGNFCSGGDVHDIIGPLVRMDVAGKVRFTRITGDVLKAMRHCPQPVVAAVDGVCAGAGAMLALGSDVRLGTLRSTVSFLFVRVGLSGADMGACAILPRIVGQGRAAELLYTGRAMHAEEAERWGFFNRLVAPEVLLTEATELAASIARGPTVAHAMTKRMLHQEWAMTVDEAIEAEAQAQAICMETNDFRRAYEAFAATPRQRPVFHGN